MNTDNSGLSVAIVVPTKNRSITLEACLTAISRQERPPEEVVVIDNGSSDSTQEVLRKFPHVRVLWDPAPNLPHLFNLGWKATSSDIVGFLNDDAIAEPSWTSDLEYWFSSLPDASAIGGPTRDLNLRRLRRLLDSGSPLLKLYDIFLLNGRVADYGLLTDWGAFSVGPEPPPTPSCVDCLTITNMAVRHNTLEQLNGFDEDFQFADMDGYFFYRMKKSGLKLYSIPNAGVDHLVHPSGATRSIYHVARDHFLMLRKLSREEPDHRDRILLNGLATAAFYLSLSTSNPLTRIRDVCRAYLDSGKPHA